MRKTDRKTDNSIRQALTEACDLALERYPGFQWLTHFVNYSDFPGSLSVLCVFDTNTQLVQADQSELRRLIQAKLAAIGIRIRHIEQCVSFDTEENCRRDHNGQWKQRLG